MRMPKFLTATVLATVFGAGAAIAGPYVPVFPAGAPFGTGGQVKSTEASYENDVTQTGQILSGILNVTNIAGSNGPTFSPGPGQSYISGVFTGFDLTKINSLGNGAFNLYFSGGSLNYYASALNPFANAQLKDTIKSPATQASAMSYIESGTLLLGLTAEACNSCKGPLAGAPDGTTLEIMISSGGLVNVAAADTSIVYLGIDPGAAGGLDAGLFDQDAFINAYSGAFAAAEYQGSANTGDCLPGQTVWQICGTDHATLSAVPEPLTLSLFGAGLAGAAAMRRRKVKKA